MSKEEIKKVLVTFPVNENQRLRLEQAAPEYRFVYRTQEDLTEEELREASVIAGNVKAELLAKAEKLE